MSRRTIVIDFEFRPSEQPFWKQDLMSNIRNFGEELYYEFSRSGHAVIDLSAVDSATNQLTFTISAPRHRGSALDFVNRKLARYKLADIARVSSDEHGAAVENRRIPK